MSRFLFRDILTFNIIGVFCIFGANITYIPAVYYTSAVTPTIVMQLGPICTYVLVIIMKMETIPNLREINGLLRIFGIFYASSGALVVILGAQSDSHTGFMTKNIAIKWRIFGYVCCFIHVLCCSFNIVIQKKYIFSDIKSKWNSCPVYVTAWSMLFYTLFAGAVSLVYIGQPEKFVNPVQGTAILPLLYSIFITTGLCYTLITWCTSQIKASIVAATWPLQVVACAVFAYLLTDEIPNATQLVGCLTICLAVVMVAWGNNLKEELDHNVKENQIK